MEEKKKVGAGFGVMILRNNKVLLGRRHSDAEKASSALRGEGTWTMPGGKMEFGESFEEGAMREVLEETGIKINSLDIMCVNNEKNVHAHFVTVGLFSNDFEGDAQVMEPDEIVEWKWFELENLPSPLFPPSEHILENYKQKKFYIKQ